MPDSPRAAGMGGLTIYSLHMMPFILRLKLGKQEKSESFQNLKPTFLIITSDS